MIFEALQSELFRFKFHSLSSKILKIPEFSLSINNLSNTSFHLFRCVSQLVIESKPIKTSLALPKISRSLPVNFRRFSDATVIQNNDLKLQLKTISNVQFIEQVYLGTYGRNTALFPWWKHDWCLICSMTKCWFPSILFPCLLRYRFRWWRPFGKFRPILDYKFTQLKGNQKLRYYFKITNSVGNFGSEMRRCCRENTPLILTLDHKYMKTLKSLIWEEFVTSTGIHGSNRSSSKTLTFLANEDRIFW